GCVGSGGKAWECPNRGIKVQVFETCMFGFETQIAAASHLWHRRGKRGLRASEKMREASSVLKIFLNLCGIPGF
ncbi:MAG: hypothetical protein ACOH08_04570, partial [Rothia mucilaginosa]